MKYNRFVFKLTAAALVTLGLSTSAFSETRGVTADTIKLGQVIALSGGLRSVGTALQDGVNGYFAALNKDGGINGRKVEVVVNDDEYNPEKSKELVTSLIEKDRVFGFVGNLGSAGTSVSRPIFEKFKTPVVGALTGAEKVRLPTSPVMFFVRPNYNEEAEKLVEYLTSQGVQKFAILHQNDEYGTAAAEGVNKALAKRTLTALETADIDTNSAEVDKAVSLIANSNPEVVILAVADIEAIGSFAIQYEKKGLKAKMFNFSETSAQNLSSTLGSQVYGMTFSTWLPSPYDTSVPIVAEYTKKMKAINPKFIPDVNSLEGFIDAKVMAEGLKRAGKDLTPESFTLALEGMKRFDVGGFPVSFSAENHEGTRSVDLVLIGKKGQLVQ